MLNIEPSPIYERQCNGCTKCCDGTLSANIRGHEMYPGKPCFFLDDLNNRCSDYENRPYQPCKVFRCGWLQDDDNSIPEWMKPDISNVLILSKLFDGKKIFTLRQCGSNIEPKTIAWFFQWALERADIIEISLYNDEVFNYVL